MKIKHLLVSMLSVILILSFMACNKTGDPSVDTTTDIQSEAPTELVTEAPTETPTEAPTESPTEAPTEEITEPATESGNASIDDPYANGKKYREDWDENDPENPFYNLIPVGKSYDGTTTCYDGRYDFGFAVCRTSDGEYFYSVQEAVWHLEELGGGSILMTENTDICLKLEIPQDFCDYRLYYQFLNVDFVFNYGNIYDDCGPNEDGINGYAYYADLYVLDGLSNLGDTNIWMIGGNEGFTDPGCYLMIDEFNEDPEYYYMYQYVLEKNLDTWPGLPLGEFLPE